MSYDYGMMRAEYTIQYLTDWMGDDAWLWKMECEMRKFNYHGDIQWFGGKVARKFQDGPPLLRRGGDVGREPARRGHHARQGRHHPAVARGGPAQLPDPPQITDARKALADRA